VSDYPYFNNNKINGTILQSVNSSPQIIIVIIISGSAVLVRTLAASHRRFRNFIKTLSRTSDQPVKKASTYTRKHITETQTSMRRAGFEHTIAATKEATTTGTIPQISHEN
jgi:hypothetical protein